jgi:hypothetical protein
VVRIAGRELLDLGRLRDEVDPELLEDCPPLRRGGRERYPWSGKNSAASRSADSFESEPWTMFWPTSSA